MWENLGNTFEEYQAKLSNIYSPNRNKEKNIDKIEPNFPQPSLSNIMIKPMKVKSIDHLNKHHTLPKRVYLMTPELIKPKKVT